MGARIGLGWVALVVTGAACTGQIVDPDGKGGGGTAQNSEPICKADTPLRPSAAPIRRLSVREYENTLRDLFPGLSLPELEVVADSRVNRYDNEASTQGISALRIETYQTNAARVAEAATANVAAWAPCNPLPDDAACSKQIALELGRRAYRRPLTTDEATRFEAFVSESATELGVEHALTMFVEAILASPKFLYRPELGAGTTPAGDAFLTDFELASRLSYFVWRTMPDDALFAAAEHGELATEAGLVTQAERLLAHSRAKHAVNDFLTQWLAIDAIDTAVLDAEAFPELTATRAAMHEASLRFATEQFWNGGVRGLLTSAQGYANDALAPLLGVAPPGTSELAPVAFDAEVRAGFLGQPSFLVGTSHGRTHSPILRGVFILEALLCDPPGAPPPEVNANLPDPEPGETLTTRDRIETSHGSYACKGCHERIDGLGFSFESFDVLGRHRTTENGVPIDTSGALVDTDIDGQIESGVELGQRLAESAQVRSCVASHAMRWALGRGTTEDDVCQVEALGEELTRADDFRQLMLAIVKSPAFRQRPAIAKETP